MLKQLEFTKCFICLPFLLENLVKMDVVVLNAIVVIKPFVTLMLSYHELLQTT